MLKYQLRLVYRNIIKYKATFFINVLGLTAGLCCTLLIYLWVMDEMSMDKFQDEHIYQVMQNEHVSGRINTGEGTPGILADALAKEIPDVAYAVTTSPGFWLAKSKVTTGNQPAFAASGKFAGKDFFKVFNYPLVSGAAHKVLADHNTIVISESLARKMFHTTDVAGKEIKWTNVEMNAESKALVSGVFKDVPANSSDQFDFLVSLDVMLNVGNSAYKQWGNYGPSTFVLLKDHADPSQFNTKIKDFLKTKGQKIYTLFTRKYTNSYLYNHFENGKITGGRITYVQLFSLIAIIILVIACINFMNLSTAKASRRVKEIGIKKVMGASRKSLIIQFLVESMAISLVAMFAALLLTELLLPQFNMLTGKNLTMQFTPALAGSLLLLTVLTGLISGSYPAAYLSGLLPSLALKGKLNLTAGSYWTRQGLVVFQFSVCVVLIVAVLIIYKQVQFVQQQDQGYQKDNVLYFETEGSFKRNVNFAIDEIRKIDGVVSASGIDRELLGDLSYTTGAFDWEGRDEKEVIRFQRADVNADLIETLGMKMVDGRSFSKQYGADTSKIIINEAGIKVMRLKNPVGKIFKLWGQDFQIIGVVKDFHYESFHQSVNPMFLRYRPANSNRIMVKIAPGKLTEVIDALKQFNNTHNSGYTLDYKFLDQDFQLQYQAESRMASLSRFFAILAVVISCLGLFGLASFTAERRFKEIGIRKVLGASHASVVYLLSRDFLKPVIIAILIALPISVIVTRYWLDTFAYRIELKVWYFAGAGLLAVAISWITVGLQAFRAAGLNPVKVLKSE